MVEVITPTEKPQGAEL